MNNKNIILVSLAFVAIAAVQGFFFGRLYISPDAFSDTMIFLSILFGFYITSLAIFVTSRYVSDLYNIVDEKDKTRTLLHKLVSNYKVGLNLILISIAYLFILISICSSPDYYPDGILMSKWFALAYVPLVIFNLVYSYRMLGDLLKIIIQEGKRHK